MSIPKILLAAAAYAASVSVHAQSIGPSAIDATGASATAGGNNYEYAIGQVVAGNTFTSASLVVTPGVLQPAASTGINGHELLAGSMHVFPSPVETTLYLQPAFGSGGLLQYNLYDAAGKRVMNGALRLLSGTERQTIELSQIAAGQYTLDVSWQQADQVYRAGYKIQKLK